MAAIIICFAIIAIILTGASYYIVIPFVFDIKAGFNAKVTDPRALAFGETLYDIIGIFPVIYVGAIFLNAYQKSVRQSNSEGGF